MLGRIYRAPREVKQRLRRAIRRRRHPHGLVLCYHRIATPTRPDPWRLCVTPEHFERHLLVLARHANVVPLAQLVDAVRSGRQGRPLVALTFDDGYVDNLDNALPLLEAYRMPATFFIATRVIGDGRAYWWDDLAQAVLRTDCPVKPIEIDLPGWTFRWGHDTVRAGTATQTERARRRMHTDLYWFLHAMNDADRRAALRMLFERLDFTSSADVRTRVMDVAEVRRLAASPLAEVGSHGLSHRSLLDMPLAERLAELEQSRHECARLTGSLPTSFAYAYGTFDSETLELVTAAGFERACATTPELCFGDVDVRCIPRFAITDADGRAFERQVRWHWLP